MVLSIVLGCAPDGARPPDRILLVTVDTLRADHVGCYGAPAAHTPHMDTLAAAGVRFAQAISPAPLTLPAHASLFTGLDPPAHGVRHNSIHRLPPDLPTVAERMGEAGYATAAFVGALVLERRFGLSRGFDHYDDRRGARRSGAIQGYAERTAERVVDAVLEWLDTAPPRFFLWVHFYDPHSTYAPPPGFRSAFAGRPYDGEIAFVDAQLGRLLDALDPGGDGSPGLLIALTSDHGESLGEHGELTHSYTLYDATQRVPLLLAGPGLPAGRVVETPVRLLDLGPTLLELAGAEPLGDVEGRSLRALAEGAEEGPRPAYLESLATRLDFGWSALHGLRDGRWKYIRAPRPELYDLASDPGELDNRAGAEPEQLARLERALAGRLAAVRPSLADVELDPGERELLRGLGYVVPDPGAAAGPASGPDPKDRIHLLGVLAEAEALFERGHPGRALERLEAVGDDGGPTILALRASAALAARQPERAERAARAALAQAPDRQDLRVLLQRAIEAQRGRDGPPPSPGDAGVPRGKQLPR